MQSTWSLTKNFLYLRKNCELPNMGRSSLLAPLDRSIGVSKSKPKHPILVNDRIFQNVINWLIISSTQSWRSLGRRTINMRKYLFSHSTYIIVVRSDVKTLGCARFPQFVQNFSERQIFWSLC